MSSPITPEQLEHLRLIGLRKWRTCERWTVPNRVQADALMDLGLVTCCDRALSRRWLTKAGREAVRLAGAP